LIRRERQVEVSIWSTQQAEDQERVLKKEAEARLDEQKAASREAERELRQSVRKETESLINVLRSLSEEQVRAWESRRGEFRDIDAVVKDRQEAEGLSHVEAITVRARMHSNEALGISATGNPLFDHDLHEYIYASSPADRRQVADLCQLRDADERERLEAQDLVIEKLSNQAVTEVVQALESKESSQNELFENLNYEQQELFSAIEDTLRMVDEVPTPSVEAPHTTVTFPGGIERRYEESVWLTQVSSSEREPIALEEMNGRFWWLYKGSFFSSSEELELDEVKVLVEEQESRKRSKIARAKAVMAMSEDASPDNQRKAIPREVKVFVWQRDQGKCVQCGSNENLEFDHIIPHSLGGADTERNLQLLCSGCNREKGDGF
jgi:hypothetical protein